MAEADEPDGTASWWSDEVDDVSAARRALVYSRRFSGYGRDIALDFPAEYTRIGTPGGDAAIAAARLVRSGDRFRRALPSVRTLNTIGGTKSTLTAR